MERAAGIEEASDSESGGGSGKASDSESSGGSFLTLRVTFNDAHIIPPPPQLSDSLFSHIFGDNY